VPMTAPARAEGYLILRSPDPLNGDAIQQAGGAVSHGAGGAQSHSLSPDWPTIIVSGSGAPWIVRLRSRWRAEGRLSDTNGHRDNAVR
jgi:hypothetical protein